jgi:ribose transport system substrate-binding protein
VALLAQHALKKTSLPTGWWNPGSLVVDKANIDKIIARQKTAASRTAYFQAEANKQLANPSQYLKPLSALGG